MTTPTIQIITGPRSKRDQLLFSYGGANLIPSRLGRNLHGNSKSFRAAVTSEDTLCVKSERNEIKDLLPVR